MAVSVLSGLKMQFEKLKSPVVVIVGPTAVGKTAVSIQLAAALDGEIVSADSRQFYRGMDIGTAKATEQEQAAVPHHLIDVADVNEIWSLAIYQEEARKVIADIHQRGKLPFLVGGTGQYIRAVLEGWNIPAQAPVPHLREALETWAAEIGPVKLYEKLTILDPQAAEKIDPNNLRRTVRALEVIFQTGRRFSVLRQQEPCIYSIKMVGLQRPRTELYQRVDLRIDQMIQEGLVEEVQRLLEKGYSPDMPNMSAIGYRQIAAYLHGEISLEEAVLQIKRLTRNFVRRQANWFKPGDPRICWFDMDEDVYERILGFIESEKGWILPG
jgi:tRNA dimethylallyltransferase